jgi:hypothetical protein
MEAEIAVYFLNQLREARARTLQDAEAFPEIIYAIERLGFHLTGGADFNLEGYETTLGRLAATSALAKKIPELHREWHLPFNILYKIVKTGRNDALHQGAFARHLTEHATQLAIVLEDALMASLTKVSDYMVRDVIAASSWQPVSFVRQQMLANSFTCLPILWKSNDKENWHLISDFQIAHYLRSASYEERNNRLVHRCINC